MHTVFKTHSPNAILYGLSPEVQNGILSFLDPVSVANLTATSRIDRDTICLRAIPLKISPFFPNDEFRNPIPIPLEKCTPQKMLALNYYMDHLSKDNKSSYMQAVGKLLTNKSTSIDTFLFLVNHIKLEPMGLSSRSQKEISSLNSIKQNLAIIGLEKLDAKDQLRPNRIIYLIKCSFQSRLPRLAYHFATADWSRSHFLVAVQQINNSEKRKLIKRAFEFCDIVSIRYFSEAEWSQAIMRNIVQSIHNHLDERYPSEAFIAASKTLAIWENE